MSRDAEHSVMSFGPSVAGAITLSVVMITYNHERFVRQSIESVLNQDISEQIELIIGEDQSTDGTREVIESACKDARMPVRLITSARNVGMHANFRRVLANAGGDFFALIEGDDWWTSKQKLREQLKVLRSNPRIHGVAHQAALLFEDGKQDDVRAQWGGGPIPHLPAGDVSVSTLAEFREMIPTASLVLRREVVADIPDWLDRLPMADCYLTLNAALRGGLCLLDECWSVYRVTASGAMTAAGYLGAKAGQVELLHRLLRHHRGQHVRTLRSALRKNVYELAHALESSGQIGLAADSLRRLAVSEARYGRASGSTLRWLARLSYPGIWRSGKDLVRMLGFSV